MLPLPQIESKQKPLLIHIVHEDDEVLLNTPDAEWFRILYYFPWEKHRIFGAEYYDALYEFNQREACPSIAYARPGRKRDKTGKQQMEKYYLRAKKMQGRGFCLIE